MSGPRPEPDPAAAASGYRFPIDRTSTRDLRGYAGPIDVWDIDKTYLLTEMERLRDLIQRAIEPAPAKSTRPGAAPLLRGLRRGAPRRAAGGAGAAGEPEAEAGASADAARGAATAGERDPPPLYFVSASPPQLRPVLEEKMHLDGIAFDGIAFKDWWRLVRRGRLRDLKRHAAYKLTALLEYRCEWPSGAREWLYGDDAESDPRIYSLYASIRAGEVEGGALDDALAALRVDDPDRAAIARLAARAQALAPPAEGGSVEGIFIFRAARTRRPEVEAFARVEVVEDALDLALRLAARGRIGPEVVDEVRAEVHAGRGGGWLEDERTSAGAGAGAVVGASADADSSAGAGASAGGAATVDADPAASAREPAPAEAEAEPA